MKTETISVTQAARSFADCVNRAHYQNVTFVLLRNGSPIARIVPDGKRYKTGKDLAEALAQVDLPEDEARAWYKDLQAARKFLRPVKDKWR